MPPNAVLSKILSPVRINRMDLDNRVLMSSMHMNFEGPRQYDRLAHFYRVRAAGGPGLIVTAGCSPDLVGRAMPDGFSLHSDEGIVEHRRIVDAVRSQNGSRLALQLLHFGREAFHGQLVAPSALRLEGNLFTPRALEHDEILAVIASFGQAATRAMAAGYDAIEIVFSQGFLIHQFLSAHTNHRTDCWGQSLENRMRFACEVAREVRRAVGSGYPLIFRIPCLDMVSGGLSFADSCALTRKLEPFQIDLLNISIGWHESDVPTIAMAVPQAGFSALAARVKHAFPHLLTCVSNRINDLRHGEELLADGVADIVAMGRPFLADAQIVAKAAAGAHAAVTRCIGCNQDCLDNVFQGKVVSCSVNPACSMPEEGLAPQALPGRPEIAVVGAGIAGMACAKRLSERGARVTLFERSPRLGGQMTLASRIPGKGEFFDVVMAYEQALRDLKVDIRLGQAFGAAEYCMRPWARVVLAVGSEPNAWAPETPGALRVLDFEQLLAGELPVEYPVVILGGGGVAVDTAKYLLARPTRLAASAAYLKSRDVEQYVGPLGELQPPARDITIVQRSTKKLAYKLGRTTRWIALHELQSKGTKFIRGASVARCGDAEIELALVDGSRRTVAARTVVVCAGQHSLAEPLMAQLGADVKLDVIGAARQDSAHPASISSSIRGAYDYANALQIEAAAVPASPALIEPACQPVPQVAAAAAPRRPAAPLRAAGGWLLRRPAAPRAARRLFCFSHAGGNPAEFLRWQAALEPAIEVLPVQWPGSGSRWSEPAVAQFDELTARLHDALGGEVDASTAFFGHSLGALLAFEVCRRLQAGGQTVPAHLFVSGCAPPHRRETGRQLHKMADAELIQTLRDFNGTPEGVLANPELLGLLLPRIRADFALAADYRWQDGPPLNIPMSVLAGRTDPHVQAGTLGEWMPLTRASCQFNWFEGDHFFVQSCAAEVLATLKSQLAAKAGAVAAGG